MKVFVYFKQNSKRVAVITKCVSVVASSKYVVITNEDGSVLSYERSIYKISIFAN